ncbi:WXG100 family type VII secretion target [Nocardia sp. NPDC057668]|uniref:WXG100 family type VII secretion target n=1 Tax=Nocardia sp. NPDC057668 TaxID=3346202 RepID=UPI003672F514
MSDELRVEFTGMRTAASGLTDVSTRIDALRATLKSAADSGDGCWGADEFGNPFAEGESGYLTRSVQLLDVLQSKVGRLNVYSTALNDAATLLEDTDDNNAGQFK